MAKVVTIEWMKPTREFNCPCCSAAVVDANGRTTSQPCSHFLFNFDESLGDFVDYADSVEPILDDTDANVTGPVDDALISALPESSTIVQIETRDDAEGPIVRKDVLAFDLLAA